MGGTLRPEGTRDPVDVFVNDGRVATPKQRRERALEAKKLFKLGADRGWIPTDSRERVQFIAAFAATYSAGYLAAARTAVTVYEAFCSRRGADPWPADPVHLCEFLQDVRAIHHAAHADTNRGTAASSRFEGISSAVRLIRAPAQAALYDMRVKAATLAPEANADRQEFNMPLAVQMIIEDCALGRHFAAARPGQPVPNVSDVEVAAARDLFVLIGLSLRTVSAARMTIIGLSAPVAALGGAKVLVCKSSGDKRAVSGDMAPAYHWCVGRGVLPGVELWLDDYVDSHDDGFLVEAIASTPKNRLDLAVERSGLDADEDDICPMLRHFAAKAPLNYSREQCIALGIAARSARHFYVALRAFLKIAELQADAGDFALGHWKLPDLRRPRSSRVSMPTGYAGSEAQLIASATTRLRVINTVRAWIGEHRWQLVVPCSATRPSFDFLLAPPVLLAEEVATAAPGVEPVAATPLPRPDPYAKNYAGNARRQLGNKG